MGEVTADTSHAGEGTEVAGTQGHADHQTQTINKIQTTRVLSWFFSLHQRSQIMFISTLTSHVCVVCVLPFLCAVAQSRHTAITQYSVLHL